MTEPWTLRALQLDLARQKEPVSTILRTVDFAAANGYNAIHLYLEGCVRTASYPQPDPSWSYSTDEMRQVVAYAREHGMDVIPQVNAFEHAERFFRHPALQALSELREGIAGRFGSAQHTTFCPSLDETYAFLERYFAEIAEVFPSPYFHVGCDEVWSIGYCSRCRGRLAAGETQADLFSRHILRLREIVAGKLGRRMLMWDDMLEEYPEALDRIPGDVIQCVWQYDDLVDRTRTHFGRRRRDDRLAEFRRRGIEFLVCPAALSALNTESFTRLAAPFRPLGGILTVWELSHSFLLERYPVVAYAGRLWRQPEAASRLAIFHGVCAELFGVTEPEFVDAVWAHSLAGRRDDSHSVEGCLRGPLTPFEESAAGNGRVLLSTLERFQARIRGETGRAVMEDMILSLRRAQVSHEWRSLVEDTYARRVGRPVPLPETLRARGAALQRDVETLRETRARQWAMWRPGIPYPQGSPLYAGLAQRVGAFLAQAETGELADGLLAVRYSLPDYYGRQDVRWRIRFAGEAAWTEVGTGVPKPSFGDSGSLPFFTVEYPVSTGGRAIEAAMIETWGYGAIGLCHVEFLTAERRFTVRGVENRIGNVRNAEAVLNDDTFWCTLGDENSRAAFLQPERSEIRHGLVVRLG